MQVHTWTNRCWRQARSRRWPLIYSHLAITESDRITPRQGLLIVGPFGLQRSTRLPPRRLAP